MLPIAMTMGDPAGIAPEITAKAWHTLRDNPKEPFFVISDPVVLSGYLTALDLPPAITIEHASMCASAFTDGLPVMPVALENTPTPGLPDVSNGAAIISSIEQAVASCKSGDACALVTNPIAKSVLYDAGFKFPGHTEFLGELASGFYQLPTVSRPVMLLSGGGLRVALVTVHTALRDVPANITNARIISVAKVLYKSLQQDFAIPSPRIALCGLNPHAGEDGALGTEEVEIINPAAATLRANGINITNAMAADALFREDQHQRYDAVLAMYHDQGLIPVKTLDFHGGTNTTMGLPFVRTSPDHGTGFDIAGKGIANANSLIAAIKQASSISTNRSKFND